MKIIDIQEREDGMVVATVADDNDKVVGYTIYTEDSVPRPQLGEITEDGIIKRIWTWITGGN